MTHEEERKEDVPKVNDQKIIFDAYESRLASLFNRLDDCDKESVIKFMERLVNKPVQKKE